MQFNLIQRDGSANLTVFLDGNMHVADDAHPHFEELVNAAVAGDGETFLNLIDASVRAAERFENLSERVSVANSRVYFDGDEIDDVYAEQIIRFLEDDVEDWKPLVNFYEKAFTNTDAHTRENLARWLNATGGFTIADNGNIIGYKGLSQDMTSIHSGPGIVNGKNMNGHLPNQPGSVVEMARSKVTHDPAVGCAAGLHVGTWEYARSFGSVVVEVEVNPRDVVSVPTDCSGQKMRVSRYEVVRVLDNKYNETVVPSGFVPSEDFLDGYDEGYEDGSDGVDPRY